MSRPVLLIVLLMSVLCYFEGISAPFATVQKESLISTETQQYSVLSSIDELTESGEGGLAAIIVIFTLLFPLTKYFCLSFGLLGGSEVKKTKLFRLVQSLGKWSMLDVFVVALLIVMMKINRQDHWYLSTRMHTESGLFIYAFSVLTSMIVASRIGIMEPNSLKPVELKNGRIVTPCGFWMRLWALVIDTALATAVVLPIMLKTYGPDYLNSTAAVHGALDFMMNWVLPVVVTVVCWVKWQATPGKMIVGAKVVDADTGRPVPVARLIGRYFGYYLSLLPLGLGLLWVGLDARRQGWHDKLARTLVIRSE